MKPRSIFIIALFISGTPLSVAQAQFPALFPMNESTLGKLKNEQRLGDYTFRFYRDEDCQDDKCGGSVLIKKGDRIVFAELYSWFFAEIVALEDHPDNQIDHNPYVNNLVGDVTPEIVLATHSGGAHCCFSYKMFSAGENLDLIWQIDKQDASCEFHDINHDGIYEVITNDTTFNYWQASHADSAYPKVILHYLDGFYLLDLDSMKHKSLIPETAAKIQSQFGDKATASMQQDPWKQASVPPTLWKIMLELIYSGNNSEAWEFFNQAWPEGAPGKQEFLQAFIGKLKTSPHWPDLEKVITLPSEE